jgi:hypothetical protein
MRSFCAKRTIKVTERLTWPFSILSNCRAEIPQRLASCVCVRRFLVRKALILLPHFLRAVATLAGEQGLELRERNRLRDLDPASFLRPMLPSVRLPVASDARRVRLCGD